MNKRRLAVLAAWLEAGAVHTLKLPDGQRMQVTFDMSRGIAVNHCGTVCCIAGAATQFFAPKRFEDRLQKLMRDLGDESDDSEEYEEVGFGYVLADARELLGLSDQQAELLFEPKVCYTVTGVEHYEDVTPAWAARVIRNLIKTGKVDWRGTKECMA